MRFLSREWASGDLSDDEWERRLADYHRHAAHIRPHLLDGAVALQEDVNLHDAVPKAWNQEAGRFGFTLIVGDLQQGYETVHLEYVGGTADVTEQVLAEWLGSPETEVWYDEVDLADGGYEHRLLLHPVGEFSIRFKALAAKRSPASASDR